MDAAAERLTEDLAKFGVDARFIQKRFGQTHSHSHRANSAGHWRSSTVTFCLEMSGVWLVVARLPAGACKAYAISYRNDASPGGVFF